MLADGQAEEQRAALGHERDAAARELVGGRRRRCPCRRARPCRRCGGSRPAIVASVVVLPAPLGPSSATTSPGATWRSRSRTTGDAVVAGGQVLTSSVQRRQACASLLTVAAEVGGDHASSSRICAGVPRGDDRPKSSTTTWSQTPSTRPMSWSTSRTVTPLGRQRPQVLAELLALVGVQARRRARPSAPAAGAGRARGRRRRACAGRARARSGSGRRRRSARRARAPSRRLARVLAAGSRQVAQRGATPMRWLATSRFSSTVRSSNSSTDWNVRTARAARAGAGAAA